MKNLVPLSKISSMEGIPVKVSTLRKWKHIRKYPDLFLSAGRKVLVDIERLSEIIEKTRGK